MFEINLMLYERLAQLLVESIDLKSFFSQILEFEDDLAQYRFSATLMIYYIEDDLPEGKVKIINNIVPVWWEFITLTEDGQADNDFDFNILKELICI